MISHVFEYFRRMIRPWEDYEFDASDETFLNKLRSGLKRLYFWSQKEYKIRYSVVLNELKKMPEACSILEVGSGALGLTRYIKREVTGVDVKVGGPRFKNMKLIHANAGNLPFADGLFDMVVSIDMLEHVPVDQRQKIIQEFIRVSKHKVIIGFPCGEQALYWEKKAVNVYNNVLTKWPGETAIKTAFILRNDFLFEHAACGLPNVDEVMGYIKGANINSSQVQVIDNESVYVWYIGVLAHMKYNYIRWMITTIMFILLYPVLVRIKWGGTYRKIFLINKRGEII